MRKTICLLLSLFLVLSLPYIAFAEGRYSWEQVGSLVEDTFGEDAHFVKINEVNARIWIPDFLESVPLTEDDLSNDAIACYMAEDSSEMIYIFYSDAGGLSLESFQQYLTKNDISSEIIDINGIPALTYYDGGNTSLMAIYSTADGFFFQLMLYPYPDTFLDIILSSVQPDETAPETESAIPVNPVSGLIIK